LIFIQERIKKLYCTRAIQNIIDLKNKFIKIYIHIIHTNKNIAKNLFQLNIDANVLG